MSFKLEGLPDTGTTEMGLGGHVALGKEWWVSERWGVGLAGQLSFSANRDKGELAPTWRTWGAGVALSATYN